jgi:hypothetical protein
MKKKVVLFLSARKKKNKQQYHLIELERKEEMSGETEHHQFQRRFTYKLHPTTVVLRSQQLNLIESQQQQQSEENISGYHVQETALAAETTATEEEEAFLSKKDNRSLIPQYSIPSQILTPKGDTLIASRTSLLHSEHPTLLPHSHHHHHHHQQQQQQSDLAREIEQHVQQQTQQQQSAFSGPFLLYRNPDWDSLKSLRLMIMIALAVDITLLLYTYFGVPFIPSLTNFRISMPMFGIVIENTEKIGLLRKIFSPILFLLALMIDLLGMFGFWKNRLRMVTYFIALGLSWVIINTIVVSVSTFLGAGALFVILRLVWFSLILWISTKARTKMQVNWYMTNQF